MSPRPPRFAADLAALGEVLEAACLLACPHCGAYGTLVGHGLLRGYAESGDATVVRGRRLLCSDRHRKDGCGRTVSVLLAECIARSWLTATTLWNLFVASCSSGVGGAARRIRWPQSTRNAFRVARRLRVCALKWRTWLCARSAPPACLDQGPEAQLCAHLSAELGPAPLSALQLATDSEII